MLFVAVVFTGFVSAFAIRKWSPWRGWLSPAATSLLAVLGATTSGLSIMDAADGVWRPLLSICGAGLAALVLAHLGALTNRYAIDPVRRFREERFSEEDVLARLQHRVDRRTTRRVNLLSLTLRSAQRFRDVRVTGLAAEMTYYGLISLVPLASALGASLGFLERIVGREQVARIEEALVDSITSIFAADVSEEILAPLIEGLLREERAGLAIGSVVVLLWLASRMFRAAIRALDDAYAVPERRSLIGQYVLGLTLALGAVITLVVLLTMVVVGPLLGGGQQIAEQLGLGQLFEVAWAALRWPAVAAVCATYLTMLYRFGPNVHTVWTRCLPGAVIGTIGLIGVALAFGGILAQTGSTVISTETGQGGSVSIAAQAIGAVLSGVLWLWLSSIVLLAGGVLNAELDHGRQRNAAARHTGTEADGKVGSSGDDTAGRRTVGGVAP